MERGDENLKKDDDDLHSLVKVELDSRINSPKSDLPPSIYKAPGILRNLSGSSFIPRIVSIGPLHRNNKNLKAFEAQKVSCVANLLERIDASSSEEIWKACMKSVQDSMEKIKACYVRSDIKIYKDHKIAEMMATDACFILEFICWRIQYVQQGKNGDLSEYKLSQAIYFDLVLLENQIPFFVLKQIYECILEYALKYHVPFPELYFLINEILIAVKLIDIDVKGDNIPTETPSHILSLLHDYYKPPSHIKSVFVSQFSFRSTVDLALCGVNIETDNPPVDLALSGVNIETDNPPVDLALSGVNIETDNHPVDLALSGVNIETDNPPEWKLQIEVKKGRFHPLLGSWSKHTLIVPKLCVGDFTGVILRNLIAYEQSCHTSNYITSYAFAMDMLVNDKEDVANLVKSKALINDMGSNEEVANMINGVCKNVIYEEYFYEEHCKTLDEYCNDYWPKHIAGLRRNNFNSPWSIIGLVAGFILFALAVINTIISIESAINNLPSDNPPMSRIFKVDYI